MERGELDSVLLVSLLPVFQGTYFTVLKELGRETTVSL